MCVFFAATNRTTRNEESKGQETRLERKSLSRITVYPKKPKASEKTVVQREAERHQKKVLERKRKPDANARLGH